MDNEEKIALIDMDGTIADYDRRMNEKLAMLASPGEPQDSRAPWMKARKRLIKQQPGFWRHLPPLEDGFKVLNLIRQVGFTLNVLTKGPSSITSAWTEKVEWCRQYLGNDVPVTVTETNKGSTYGRVLFDDWPPFVLSWLEWRPRGFVVMLGHPWNEGFTHPNVFRVDRNNLDRDLEALLPLLQQAYSR